MPFCHVLCIFFHFITLPSWGLCLDCPGQAGRCDPLLQAKDDPSPHPTEASGSAGHQQDPKTDIYFQPEAILIQDI